MEFNLKGKRCLITGGSKGIGLAIKKALEKEGVEVISWSRSEGVDLMKEIPKIPFETKIDFVIYNFGGGGTWQNAMDIMKSNYFTMLDIQEQIFTQVTRVICISSIFGKEKGDNPLFAAAKSALSLVIFTRSSFITVT